MATTDEVTVDEVRDGAAGASAEKSAFQFKLDRSHAGQAAPDFAFGGPDGKPHRLADFAGRPLLVNLWATWCAPCIAEMPTLDSVAGSYGARGLQVLPISQDNGGQAQVAPFFAKKKFAQLKPYFDPESRFSFHYETGMLPTSVLYDARGKEVVRVIGAMNWGGKDGKALLDGLVK